MVKMNTRKTILIYQYSERIKSGLIVAFNLLVRMSSLQGKELFGTEKEKELL
jgi:transcriptional regulator with AAA-type ATPase domain